MFLKLKIATASAVAATIAMGASAYASAIIDNGVIQLGVDDFGQLNVPGGVASPVDGTEEVGLRFLPTGNEGTAHGCLCEGWGVGIADADGNQIISGSANNDDGIFGLTAVSFSSTATTATSVVDLGSLRITHSFAPAAETPNLYRVSVNIENTGTEAAADVRYRRTFDWDVEPESFEELVTIQGSEAATAVIAATDDGFCDSDPFAFCGSIVSGGTGDFVDLGPEDHGANLDFSFGGLNAGESVSFEIFYGAAATESVALSALASVSAEVFSLGQCGTDPDGTGENGCNTFILGFAGTGGEVFVDPSVSEVPLPAALPLFLMGVAGLGFSNRRKKN